MAPGREDDSLRVCWLLHLRTDAQVGCGSALLLRLGFGLSGNIQTLLLLLRSWGVLRLVLFLVLLFLTRHSSACVGSQTIRRLFAQQLVRISAQEQHTRGNGSPSKKVRGHCFPILELNKVSGEAHTATRGRLRRPIGPVSQPPLD